METIPKHTVLHKASRSIFFFFGGRSILLAENILALKHAWERDTADLLSKYSFHVVQRSLVLTDNKINVDKTLWTKVPINQKLKQTNSLNYSLHIA